MLERKKVDGDDDLDDKVRTHNMADLSHIT